MFKHHIVFTDHHCVYGCIVYGSECPVGWRIVGACNTQQEAKRWVKNQGIAIPPHQPIK